MLAILFLGYPNKYRLLQNMVNFLHSTQEKYFEIILQKNEVYEMSNDINNILQNLKDSMQDPVESEQRLQTKPQPKKNNNRKQNPDPSVPFSEKEMLELSQELLNHDTAYREPIFAKKNTSTKRSAPKLETPIVQFDTSSLLHSLEEIQERLIKLDKKVEINSHTKEANSIKINENPQPLEIVKLMVAETQANESTRYQLQTRDGIREISLSKYYDMSKFVSMLQQYHYSMIVDKTIVFENDLFNRYRDYLIIISQNMLANSFRFFEKNKILNETITLGEQIKGDLEFTAKAVDMLELIFVDMKEALLLSQYQKDFYFAKLLNDRGFILNAVTIINEMLGEYIVESAQQLSPVTQARIQQYLDKIELTRSSRRAFYAFYKSARDFFVSHFSSEKDVRSTTLLPFRDSGNDEIEREMMKLYSANKMNKSNLFIAYSKLIERVRLIRNDLAHGNTARTYSDITKDIAEVLIDFEYLAIQKNFLQS